jgi:hypothetical protein
VAVKDELASILTLKPTTKLPAVSEIKPVASSKISNPFKKPSGLQISDDINLNDLSD